MVNEIIGYKGLNENLQAFNGFQYEIGKTYEIENCCARSHGFHFVPKLENVFENVWIDKDKIRIVKIKAIGNIDNRLYFLGDSILCTNKIEILEEIPKDEIEKYINKLNLDYLKIDHLKICTRKSLAEYGYRLDELVDDPYPDVRVAVAEQGYGLEKLVNDQDSSVRRAVAMQGFGLEKLIDDEDPFVRLEVASQGYGLHKLINDNYITVKGKALSYISENDPELMKSITELIFQKCNKGE